MTRPRRSLAALLALIIALGSPAGIADASRLPDLGDESATVISPLQERKLGEDFMRRARQHLDIVEDPELKRYIQNLGRHLAAGTQAGGQDFYFFLVDDPSVNAFAVPGGFIGVHTGLVLTARSEGELAAVLAHEIAHLTQRHIPRMMAEAKRTSVPAMAALLAAILLAGSGHSGGEAAIALTTATLAQSQLNFTRSFEQEADRIGMGVLTDAGFDARDMPAFFDRMLVASRLYESNLPEFLRTHPITTRRIAESRDHADRFPRRPNPDATDFAHAQARIRALAKASPAELVKRFAAELDEPDVAHGDALRYAYALALLRAQRFDAARAEVDVLLKQRPDYVAYRILQAEIAFGAGRRAEALALYAAAQKLAPDDPSLIQRHADALLAAGKAAQARELLNPVLRQPSADAALYKLMATAAGESGDRLTAHRALAEHYYLRGDARAALQQLHLATRHAQGNHYYTASLEARAKEIKDEVELMKQNGID